MWKISYYDESVEEGVLELPDRLLARYVRLTETMIEYGPNLSMPHTETLDAGLFELRLKGKEGIARVFYCTIFKMEILMLHAFVKKTQKTLVRALENSYLYWRHSNETL
jgi:phage-related protein